MTSCFPRVPAPTELSYFFAITSLVFSIIVSIGNLLIILSVTIDPLKKLRSPFTFFLVNLAISDLAVGVITLPMSYVAHMHEARTGSIPENLVPIFHMSAFVSATASLLSLGVLCFDRFVAIKWPIRYRHSLSLTRCMVVSLFIWLLSGALSLFYFLAGFLDHLMIFAHVGVIFTFTILVVTYRQVYLTLRQREKELRAIQGETKKRRGDENRNVNSEKKVTRAFLYILGLFICSYFPAIVMIYILQFCDTCSCTLRHVLRDLVLVFSFANSTMNPFICTIRLPTFRRSILAILKCQIRRRDRHSFAGDSNPQNIGIDNVAGIKRTEMVQMLRSG